MARRQTHHRGYVRGGPGDEADLLQCGHCSGSVEVRPGPSVLRAGDSGQSAPCGFCRCCMRFLCQVCEVRAASAGCSTWEDLIDRMEAEGLARQKLAERLDEGRTR